MFQAQATCASLSARSKVWCPARSCYVAPRSAEASKLWTDCQQVDAPWLDTVSFLWSEFLCFLWVSKSNVVRLGRGKDNKKHARHYIQSAKTRIVLRSAAIAWAEGVPWSTAVEISTKPIEAAAVAEVRKLPAKCALKAKAKSKPKAKAKPKAAAWNKRASGFWVVHWP